MNEIYLDNGATTKPSDAVVDIMMKTLTTDYGNPSSLHHKGMEAEKYIKEASGQIAKALNVDTSTIYFTSGGSEANNLAIKGVASAYKRKGKHIITTVMEHKAVANPMQYLKEVEDYEITYLKIDKDGKINIDELSDEIRQDTVLVSIMHVNNEVGAIQPIEEIGKAIKNKNSDTLFHVDAIQSFGKLKINPIKCKVDLLSISGHKFHGPKGIGALYINKGLKITPIIHGGGQQRNIRSGTENTHGIAGLAVAVKEAYEQLETNEAYIRDLKKYFYERLTKEVDGIYVNGPDIDNGVDHILSLRIEDVRGEVLLHSLENEKIYISTGSACSSNKPEEKSPTLYNLGLNRTQIDESIRVSFSKYNTKEEIDHVVKVLAKIIPRLRKFTLGGKRR